MHRVPVSVCFACACSMTIMSFGRVRETITVRVHLQALLQTVLLSCPVFVLSTFVAVIDELNKWLGLCIMSYLFL